MPVVMGLDIGGAYTKACWLEIEAGQITRARGESLYYEVWRDPAGLQGVLARFKEQGAGRATRAIGLTMTAELCDVFPSRARGVGAILAAARQAFDGIPVYVWTLRGDFAGPDEAAESPLEAAAANWLAGATVLARSPLIGATPALLVDMGSTTTDILPLDRGRVEVYGRTDAERLARGELVYTGVIRTPVHAVTDSVFIHGRPCRVASEYFAIMADVYRLLGYLREEDYTAAVPDSGARTPEGCARRLARVVASEAGVLGRDGLYAMAGYLQEKQIQQITEAIWQVLSRRRGKNGFCGREQVLRLPPVEAGERQFYTEKPLPPGRPEGPEMAAALPQAGREPYQWRPPDWPRRLIMAGQGIFLLEQIAWRLGWEANPWWELVPGGQDAGTGGGPGEKFALTAYAVAWLLAAKLGIMPG